MEQFLYALFVMLDGFSIGSAVFLVWASARLLRQPGSTPLATRRHKYKLLAGAGYALTAAILLLVVILSAEGSVQGSLAAWLYLVGLSLAGFGFSGLARVSIDELAALEGADQ